MMKQKTLQVGSKDINILEDNLTEIIVNGGTINIIIPNTARDASAKGWLVVYTPQDI